VADVNFYFDSGYFGIKIDGETYGMGASDTDTLSIALNEEGHAQIMATGTIATPVPAAVWLLGSGLMGLLGIRRKMAC
jgi:hypothetical protein